MGLDIIAYKNVKKIDKPTDEELDEFQAVHVDPRQAKFFAGREEGLELGGWYTGHAVEGFSAGSYTGYGEFCDALARLAGYPANNSNDGRYPHQRGAAFAKSGPFWELIYFPDNEGVIGPVVSAKLAKDFADWQERAREAWDVPGGWHIRLYDNFHKAFQGAADGGCVYFF